MALSLLLSRLRSGRELLLAPRSKEHFAALPVWQRSLVVPARIGFAVSSDVLRGQLTLRAMSLVYTTLLSLVPLLAISFSILKGFGVHNRIEPFLRSVLEPLGAKGIEITERIIEFVNNIQVGVLGFVGFLMLFYTVISLLQKVERSFNYIWFVPGERSIPQKVRDYLSAVILGPVLIIGGMGVFASLMSSDIVNTLAAFGPLGHVLEQVGRLTSLAVIVGTFTFIYAFLPNTRVRILPALAGGAVAAAMWVVIGWGFASFVVGSAKYTVIYSAFATLVLFMIWLYLVWLIVLIGNAVAFYAQNPHYIGVRRDVARYAITLVEKAALTAVYLIVRDWYDQRAHWSLERLANETDVPMPVLAQALDALSQAGIIDATGEEGGYFVPAVPPETTVVKRALDAVRSDAGTGHPATGSIRYPAAVETAVRQLDAAVEEKLGAMTLKEFALDSDAAPHLRQAAP